MLWIALHTWKLISQSKLEEPWWNAWTLAFFSSFLQSCSQNILSVDERNDLLGINKGPKIISKCQGSDEKKKQKKRWNYPSLVFSDQTTNPVYDHGSIYSS